MSARSRRQPVKDNLPDRDKEISLGNANSDGPNTSSPTPPTPVHFGPKPLAPGPERVVLALHQPPEVLWENPPKTPALISFRFDGHDVNSFGEGLVDGMSPTMRTEMSPLSLDEPSLSIGYFPELGPEISDESYSSDSAVSVPYLDISDDSSGEETSPVESPQPPDALDKPPPCMNQLPNFDLTHTTPSAPRDFFADYATRSSTEITNSVDVSVPNLTPPQLAMGPSYPLPPKNGLPPQQTFNRNKPEGPWDRLDTLATIATTAALARDGDKEMADMLKTVRRSEIGSEEFSECLGYLSHVQYSEGTQGWGY
ncbi:hypothetical protein TWF718_005856 [Orbilia javanica]|uniref:Uncharacterized protein n=1 Tax=Orbilia javanica TaxID=47235 RepID=A0AAN8NXN1_9PEZI